MRSQSFSGVRRKQVLRLRAAAVVALFALVLYGAWKRQNIQEQPDDTPAAQIERPPPASATDGTTEPPVPIATAHEPPGRLPTESRIPRQTIRNQDGQVAFRGDVDVGPTLDRIERGERLEFSHDGTTFQNRERRLPQKPPGYYKEYVHPTPHLGGPGPQRIIAGRGGEIYYTPDHYRTFQRLDQR